jgi:putative spermidine/putrescine transport system permease protein
MTMTAIHTKLFLTRLWWAALDGVIRLKGSRARISPLGAGYLWMTPAVIIVGFLVVGMGYIIIYSVFRYHPEKFVIPAFTFENYVSLLSSPDTLKVFGRTFSTSLIVTIASLVFAYPYAYIIVRVRSVWLQKILLVALFLPFFTGEVVRAYAWLILLGRQGLVNTVVTGFGFHAIDLIYNRFSVTVGLVHIMLPFAVLMLAPALTNIGQDMEMAAMNLGAGKIRTLCYVVLPLSRPGIVAATIVVFTLSITEYAIPAILGGGLFDFMANRIYQIFFHVLDFPRGSAFSVILVISVSLMIPLAFGIAALIARFRERREIVRYVPASQRGGSFEGH